MFYGNTNNTNSNGKPVAPGTINATNLLLAKTPIGYVSPGAPNYNYHLKSSSPAIDQALGSISSTDMDSQPRPHGFASDVGADEFMILDRLYLPMTLH
jgi:hypothetical protein